MTLVFPASPFSLLLIVVQGALFFLPWTLLLASYCSVSFFARASLHLVPHFSLDRVVPIICPWSCHCPPINRIKSELLNLSLKTFLELGPNSPLLLSSVLETLAKQDSLSLIYLPCLCTCCFHLSTISILSFSISRYPNLT